MIAGNHIAARLPRFTGNTPTYNDEGTGTSGWTQTNAIVSQPSGSVVRLTQNVTGTQSFLRRAVTMPVTNKDWCLYGRVRASASSTGSASVQLIGTGTLRCILYFNLDSVTPANTVGAISMRYTGATGTNSNAMIATGVNTVTDWTDFAMYFDKTFNTLSVFLRQTDGSWKFGAHVFAGFFGGELAITCNNTTVASSWIEFDFLTLTSADIIAIGDSITKGATLFDPQQTGGLHDGDSTWMRWCPIYTNNRNNLIVNKGIGGQTSTVVNARLQADVMDNLPKLVFLAACNNDYPNSVSLATRTSNAQSSLNMITGGGAKAILWNPVYHTQAFAGNPAYRTYYEQWWREYRCTLTGVYRCINPMVALRDSTGYMDTAYTQSDGTHPNVAGYTRMGKYMAGKRLT